MIDLAADDDDFQLIVPVARATAKVAPARTQSKPTTRRSTAAAKTAFTVASSTSRPTATPSATSIKTPFTLSDRDPHAAAASRSKSTATIRPRNRNASQEPESLRPSASSATKIHEPSPSIITASARPRLVSPPIYIDCDQGVNELFNGRIHSDDQGALSGAQPAPPPPITQQRTPLKHNRPPTSTRSPVYKCPVCSVLLSALSESSDVHMNSCLDANSSLATTSNPAAALVEPFACMCCGRDLTEEPVSRREAHVNACLDSPFTRHHDTASRDGNLGTAKSDHTERRKRDSSLVSHESSLGMLASCPCCVQAWQGEAIKSVEGKITHARQCAKMKSISLADLVELIENAVSHIAPDEILTNGTANDCKNGFIRNPSFATSGSCNLVTSAVQSCIMPASLKLVVVQGDDDFKETSFLVNASNHSVIKRRKLDHDTQMALALSKSELEAKSNGHKIGGMGSPVKGRKRKKKDNGASYLLTAQEAAQDLVVRAAYILGKGGRSIGSTNSTSSDIEGVHIKVPGAVGHEGVSSGSRLWDLAHACGRVVSDAFITDVLPVDEAPQPKRDVKVEMKRIESEFAASVLSKEAQLEQKIADLRAEHASWVKQATLTKNKRIEYLRRTAYATWIDASPSKLPILLSQGAVSPTGPRQNGDENMAAAAPTATQFKMNDLIEASLDDQDKESVRDDEGDGVFVEQRPQHSEASSDDHLRPGVSSTVVYDVAFLDDSSHETAFLEESPLLAENEGFGNAMSPTSSLRGSVREMATYNDIAHENLELDNNNDAKADDMQENVHQCVAMHNIDHPADDGAIVDLVECQDNPIPVDNYNIAHDDTTVVDKISTAMPITIHVDTPSPPPVENVYDVELINDSPPRYDNDYTCYDGDSAVLCYSPPRYDNDYNCYDDDGAVLCYSPPPQSKTLLIPLASMTKRDSRNDNQDIDAFAPPPSPSVHKTPVQPLGGSRIHNVNSVTIESESEDDASSDIIDLTSRAKPLEPARSPPCKSNEVHIRRYVVLQMMVKPIDLKNTSRDKPPGMPLYESMSYEELKKIALKFGFKTNAKAPLVAQLNRMWLALNGFPSPVNDHPGSSLPLQVEPPMRISAALAAAAAAASDAAKKTKRRAVAAKRGEVMDDDNEDDDDEEEDETSSLYRMDADLANKLREFFTDDLDLYMKILRYEPLNLDDIHKRLTDAEKGIVCPKTLLAAYLDKQSKDYLDGVKPRENPTYGSISTYVT
ncbi:hypothetical protein SeMB42_g05727 [Synchytrium endobioticum]|uniref:Structure-specific endonuclease subunit SLX4 n=1 Tax=Synchytrium endobioticum TaxID=286115 RepID=A0A507CPP8_9FUNG|nr:hypothetical protein SeMB42_g05727 [Synchytrium endobioticum]